MHDEQRRRRGEDRGRWGVLGVWVADGALRALIELQACVEAIATARATPEPRLRVRAGAHTGTATPVAGDYVALPVNVAARVTSAAGAGQVLVSPAVVEALSDSSLIELAGEAVGEYALKDVRGPMALYRVTGDAATPRASPYKRTNVATPVTSFVGRTAEMADLRDLVAANRLVTVLGPGGMGKTRLASHLVLQVADSYEAGAWLIELASISTDEQVVGQVAATLGSTATTMEDLATDLGGRGSMLLLLDNCEHVIDAASRVAAQLVAELPALRILATSRESLQVENEVVWRIPSLTDQDTLCELFEQRLVTAAGGRSSSRPDRGDVAMLCDALDGSPLAIELAAVHALDVPISRLISVVREGTEPLARRGGGRQSSLDAVVAWTMDRLDRPLREALLVLSQAPARLTADEAALMLGDLAAQHETTAEGLLRGLVRVSLVDLDGYQYRLLDTIRGAARRALYADAEFCSRARAMLHGAAAALVDVDNDFSLVHLDDPQADRLLLFEEAVLDAWRDRTPGLGEVWMTLGYIAFAQPLSDRLRAAAGEAVQEVPDTTAIPPDDALRIGGALFILRNAAEEIPWDVETAVRFGRAAAAGSPASVAARAVHAVTIHLSGRGHITEMRDMLRLETELANQTQDVFHIAGTAITEAKFVERS